MRARRGYSWGVFALLLALGQLPLLLSAIAGAKVQAAAPARARLAVLIVFDQMRADYLQRWDKLFGAGGFHRMEQEGTWFQNCNYPYAYTATGPGHASLGTGCSPAKHGIVGNDWYDRASKGLVYCARTVRGGSPERMLMPTLGDALKEATGGKGRVVALSYKDRAAVLPGGRQADACYWVKDNSATFITSSFYRERPHPWVEEYNRSGVAERWFGKEWLRLRPDLDYVPYSGPDDVIGEGTGTKQGRTFPHPFPGGPMGPTKDYYDALYNSPFGNELLLGLAKRAIDAEHLGASDIPDFLSVSFSPNDLVGHTWGPDSQEVLDVTLRSDLVVKDLLDYLDAKVGKGRYVVALTADHGVCPLPEVSRSQGKDAKRAPGGEAKAEEFLTMTYGKKEGQGAWIESIYGLWIYLNRDLIRQRGLKIEDVEETLAAWLRQQPSVGAAYTRTQLLRGVPREDAIGQRFRQSFHPDRCGEVGVVMKPYYLHGSGIGAGTNHGTPYPYDTHVPLLVYGTCIHTGVRQDAVTPQAATVILARALGIKPPAGAEYPVPENLFDVSSR